MRKKLYQRDGFVFVTAILALVVMLLIGTAFLNESVQQYSHAQYRSESLHAVAMADAGMEYAIWRQKYSGTPVTDANILPQTTDVRALGTGTSTLTPHFRLIFGTSAEDHADVWLVRLAPPGTTTAYQVISRGYYRGYDRSLRAVLQGLVRQPVANPEVIPPPQLKYAIFTKCDSYIDTSTNVAGDLGSNGSINLNTSGGGSIVGNVYAAAAVVFKKNSTYVNGSVTYGTKLLDGSGNDITDSPSAYVSGTSRGGATAQTVPAFKRETYMAWADKWGTTAYLPGSRITSASQLTAPILYCNKANTPGYTLEIDTPITQPITIFVDGDIRLNGNISVGTPEKPVVLIATGSIICNGSPVIRGVAWANGTFGNGTPTIVGSIICNNLAAFQGNVQINYGSYPNAQVVPPTDPLYMDNQWGMQSWEIL